MPSGSVTCRSHSFGYGLIAKRADGPTAVRFGRRDRDAGVDGDDAGLVGQHRIEIDLADLGKIRGELRQLDQEKLRWPVRPPRARCDRL